MLLITSCTELAATSIHIYHELGHSCTCMMHKIIACLVFITPIGLLHKKLPLHHHSHWPAVQSYSHYITPQACCIKQLPLHHHSHWPPVQSNCHYILPSACCIKQFHFITTLIGLLFKAIAITSQPQPCYTKQFPLHYSHMPDILTNCNYIHYHSLRYKAISNTSSLIGLLYKVTITSLPQSCYTNQLPSHHSHRPAVQTNCHYITPIGLMYKPIAITSFHRPPVQSNCHFIITPICLLYKAIALASLPQACYTNQLPLHHSHRPDVQIAITPQLPQASCTAFAITSPLSYASCSMQLPVHHSHRHAIKSNFNFTFTSIGLLYNTIANTLPQA